MLTFPYERSEDDSMTSQQIKEVSLKHFAQHGYEGASLAQIADDVGIKKQSIYTHFKGKDELFLQLCSDACENELRFVMNFIESNSARPLKEFLFDFLLKYIDRYEKCDSAKFWIRTAFFSAAPSLPSGDETCLRILG